MPERMPMDRPSGPEAVVVIRPTPGVWTVATAAYAVLYVVFERSGAGNASLRDLVSNLAFLPLNLLVATLNLLASRHPSLDIGVRRALRLLGAGAVMVLIGNLISVSYFFSRGESPAVSWADPFYLADSGFTLRSMTIVDPQGNVRSFKVSPPGTIPDPAEVLKEFLALKG